MNTIKYISLTLASALLLGVLGLHYHCYIVEQASLRAKAQLVESEGKLAREAAYWRLKGRNDIADMLR